MWSVMTHHVRHSPTFGSASSKSYVRPMSSIFDHLQASVDPERRTPASVTAIDLPRLAALVGCSVREISGGLSSSGGRAALVASGRVADSSEAVVAFESRVPAEEANSLVDTALLSVASRPSILDTSDAPKALMEIGGKPVILHVLAQLHAGGIRKAVIVLGSRGAIIRDAIVASPIASELYLQFVDLGEHYSQGFARSLLEARPLLLGGGRPLLLCTSDHIFDAAIVRELASTELAPAFDAIALVEDNATGTFSTCTAPRYILTCVYTATHMYYQ